MSGTNRNPAPIMTPEVGRQALAEQTARHRRYRQKFEQGTNSIGRLSDPQWVIVGCQVDAGVRLYASRDVDARFWLQEAAEHSQECEWELTARMRDMLVVTEPTYPEALAKLQQLWAARDRAAAQRAALDSERKAITQ